MTNTPPDSSDSVGGSETNVSPRVMGATATPIDFAALAEVSSAAPRRVSMKTALALTASAISGAFTALPTAEAETALRFGPIQTDALLPAGWDDHAGLIWHVARAS